MKILEKPDKELVDFNDLKFGTTFEFYNQYYIKVKEATVGAFRINAVNLTTGDYHVFGINGRNTQVTPVEMEARVIEG